MSARNRIEISRDDDVFDYSGVRTDDSLRCVAAKTSEINRASAEDIIAACLHKSKPDIPMRVAQCLVNARPFSDAGDAKARVNGLTAKGVKKLEALGLAFKPAWPLVQVVDSFLADHDPRWVRPTAAQAYVGSLRYQTLQAECAALSRRTGACLQQLMYKQLTSRYGIDVEEWWAQQQRLQQAQRRAAALVIRQQRQQRRNHREQELMLVQQRRRQEGQEAKRSSTAAIRPRSAK